MELHNDIEDEDPEITLQTLKDYLQLHSKVEAFLRNRCKELNIARNSIYEEPWNSDDPSDVFIGFSIKENEIDIYFADDLDDYYDYESPPKYDSYTIPLDILFDEKLYEIMVNKYKQMKTEKDADTEIYERNRELKLLEELKKKYEGGKK